MAFPEILKVVVTGLLDMIGVAVGTHAVNMVLLDYIYDFRLRLILV